MKIKPILTLVALIAGLTAAAESPSVTETFAAELAAKGPQTQTIVCDFTETHHLSVLTEEAVQKGRFSYKRPGRMLLDFASGNRIVMTEELFLIRTEGRTTKARMNSNPMLRQMQAILKGCMTGELTSLKGSGEMEVTATERGYRVRLVPASRSARKYVSAVVLDFDRRDMTLDELRMEQPSGDYIHYRFRGKRLNEPLDERLFQTQ